MQAYMSNKYTINKEKYSKYGIKQLTVDSDIVPKKLVDITMNFSTIDGDDGQIHFFGKREREKANIMVEVLTDNQTMFRVEWKKDEYALKLQGPNSSEMADKMCKLSHFFPRVLELSSDHPDVGRILGAQAGTTALTGCQAGCATAGGAVGAVGRWFFTGACTALSGGLGVVGCVVGGAVAGSAAGVGVGGICAEFCD